MRDGDADRGDENKKQTEQEEDGSSSLDGGVRDGGQANGHAIGNRLARLTVLCMADLWMQNKLRPKYEDSKRND